MRQVIVADEVSREASLTCAGAMHSKYEMVSTVRSSIAANPSTKRAIWFAVPV